MFRRDDTLIIFMKRAVSEIVASQNRPIYESSPDKKWTTRHEPVELMKYGRTEGVISEVKYAGWDAQKPFIRHTLDLDYASLAAHPLWVEAGERVNFGPKQTVKKV
jgi:phage tail protein X